MMMCFVLAHNLSLFNEYTQMYSLQALSYPILSFLSQVPGLLGDPSRLLLQKVLGLRSPAQVPLGKGLLGDSPTGEPARHSLRCEVTNATVGKDICNANIPTV